MTSVTSSIGKTRTSAGGSEMPDGAFVSRPTHGYYTSEEEAAARRSRWRFEHFIEARSCTTPHMLRGRDGAHVANHRPGDSRRRAQDHAALRRAGQSALAAERQEGAACVRGHASRIRHERGRRNGLGPARHVSGLGAQLLRPGPERTTSSHIHVRAPAHCGDRLCARFRYMLLEQRNYRRT